jgi:hypothetical protein
MVADVGLEGKCGPVYVCRQGGGRAMKSTGRVAEYGDWSCTPPERRGAEFCPDVPRPYQPRLSQDVITKFIGKRDPPPMSWRLKTAVGVGVKVSPEGGRLVPVFLGNRPKSPQWSVRAEWRKCGSHPNSREKTNNKILLDSREKRTGSPRKSSSRSVSLSSGEKRLSHSKKLFRGDPRRSRRSVKSDLSVVGMCSEGRCAGNGWSELDQIRVLAFIPVNSPEFSGRTASSSSA